jgi:hypothetical protein
MQPQHYASLGAGDFEFPITGTFVTSREGDSVIFESEDESCRYYVGLFGGSRGVGGTHQLAALESLIERNWSSFVAEEGGVVRVPFVRENVGAITIASMASEFTYDGELQYYVQFAAMDDQSVATVFAEGLGPALPAYEHLLPIVRQLRHAGGA